MFIIRFCLAVTLKIKGMQLKQNIYEVKDLLLQLLNMQNAPRSSNRRKFEGEGYERP
jgi:hypothetical protein